MSRPSSARPTIANSLFWLISVSPGRAARHVRVHVRATRRAAGVHARILAVCAHDRGKSARIAFGALHDARLVALRLLYQPRGGAARARENVVRVGFGFLDDAGTVLARLGGVSEDRAPFLRRRYLF